MYKVITYVQVNCKKTKKKRLKNSPKKNAGKDFEDEFLLHQYCKIDPIKKIL